MNASACVTAMRLATAVLALALVEPDATAQLREGQSTVLEPPAPRQWVPPPDVAPAFARAYERAGRPRVLLFWNEALSEVFASPTATRDVVKQSSASSRNAMEQATAGPAGTARTSDSDARDESTRTTTRTSGYVEESRRHAALSERNAALLQQTFISEMRRGGVRFVDKALAVRTTAAKQHRNGNDPKLVEMDALLANSDLLMEILFVVDKDAPMGYAFDVRVKDIKAGMRIASIVTRADPPLHPGAPAGWATGESGYERRPAAPSPKPGVSDVGKALARDVMTSLQDELTGVAR